MYKTHILKNPIQIKNSMKNNSVKANIFDIKEIEKDNSITNSSDGNQSKIDNETKKSNESSLLLNDLINIERLKKNNIIKEKKNPTYWNN